MKLNKLQNKPAIKNKPPQIEFEMDEAAAKCSRASTTKELKKNTRENQSIIIKRMWDISLLEIVLPVLNIILGITKKAI